MARKKTAAALSQTLPKTPVAVPVRYPLPDLLRGLAVLLMMIYHFCYDLVFVGVLVIHFQTEPFWLIFRGLIVSLFLGVMGASLYLGTRDGLRWSAWWRRWGWLLLAAGLVSLGSYQIFPDRFIYFGVLHFIALASLLALPFRNLGWLNLGLGGLCVGLGVTVTQPFFDQAAWQWVGLMTFKPATEDYVPFLPWFGVVLLGIWVGSRLDERLLGWPGPAGWARLPRYLGRHALLVYLLHQPLLLGMLLGLRGLGLV